MSWGMREKRASGARPGPAWFGSSVHRKWVLCIVAGGVIHSCVMACEMAARQMPLTWASLAVAHARSPLAWVFAFTLALALYFLVTRGEARASAESRIAGLERMCHASQEEARSARAEAETHRAELARMTSLHAIAGRRFEELFQGLPIACFTFDREGTVFECNRECERMYGFPAHLAQQSKVTATLWREAPPELVADLLSRAWCGETIHNVEMEATRADGQGLCCLVSTFPFAGHDGKITGAIVATVDITERKLLEVRVKEQMTLLDKLNQDLKKKERKLESANRRLQHLAETDSLTGVANRRAFRGRLDAEVEKAREESLCLSVLLLDVDHFKRFNDEFGHQAGDKVLAQVARILREEVRTEDFVARFGGEEFVVLLPSTAPNQAVSVAERLRCAIEAAPWEFAKVTASFGIATGSNESLNARLLVEQADSAMYASKEAGRNRVTHFWSVAPDAPKRKAA